MFKTANTNSKNDLSTPVNISGLSIELAHHPDTDFTNYLLSGLKHGFKPGVVCPLSKNIICNNLQSVLTEPDIVENLIKKEVESGFMIGPLDDPAFKVFILAPLEWLQENFRVKNALWICQLCIIPCSQALTA